jgi:hypothetical protein
MIVIKVYLLTVLGCQYSSGEPCGAHFSTRRGIAEGTKMLLETDDYLDSITLANELWILWNGV